MKKIEALIDEEFTDYDGALINIPECFRYDKIKHKRYEIKKIGGHLYAIAREPVLYENEFSNINKKPDTYTLGEAVLPIDCKSGDLLFSMLRLRYRIEKNKSLLVTNEKNQTLITEWCKTYGLPFQGRLSNINRCQSDDLLVKQGLLGFSMYDFMPMLSKIYKAFSMYLVVKDIDKPKNISGLSKEQCIEYLKREFEGLELFTRFDFENLKYVMVANNLFQAAMYQLMLFTTIKRIDGKLFEIALCALCNKPFLLTRRNKKYCENCYPQKAYKSKKDG